MCMLFVYCNQQPGPDELAVVVLSIRDEYFMRPTAACHFWPNNPSIIGGMDLENGREGGTWLAMNRDGRLGALLNVLQPIDEVRPGKRHRGFLVTDFVTSGLQGPDYLTQLASTATDHAEFTMVTLDFKLRTGSTVVSYFTNIGSFYPIVCQPRVMTFSNNQPMRPWLKTIVGNKLFENISQRYIKVSMKRHLVSELFSLMNDDTRYYPDDQLMNDGRGYDEEYLKALSSIRVRIPSIGFGTRTQSVILIDSKGRADYIERTIGEEGLLGPEKAWPHRSFKFRIGHDTVRAPIYSMSRL